MCLYMRVYVKHRLLYKYSHCREQNEQSFVPSVAVLSNGHRKIEVLRSEYASQISFKRNVANCSKSQAVHLKPL